MPCFASGGTGSNLCRPNPGAFYLMPKLSFMKWYPADWIQDTRGLSLQAKGAWIDLLNFMWNSAQRGLWQGSYEELSWLIGTTVQTAQAIVLELSKVADVKIENVSVTLKNRRMIKEDLSYKLASERQSRYRSNANNDRSVTAKTLDVRLKTLDVKTTTTTKSKREPFVIPTAEEVKSYIHNQGIQVDAALFFSYYESNGWKVGKNPMKNWKAALGVWQRNGLNQGGQNGEPRYKSIFEQAAERRRKEGPGGLRKEIPAGSVFDRIRNLPKVLPET